MNTQKHLNLDARMTIQLELNNASSFKTIGLLLEKDCTTISMQEPIDPKKFTKMLTKKWSSFPDVLTVRDVIGLIGYSQSTLSYWVMQEKVVGVLYYNRYLIPEDSLIKYLASDGHNRIQQKSEKYKDLICKYLEAQHTFLGCI